MSSLITLAQSLGLSLVIVAGLLGGGLGLATHVTKLGLRVAVDTSPEPVSNGIVNTAVAWTRYDSAVASMRRRNRPT